MTLLGWHWFLIGCVCGLGVGGILWWFDANVYQHWLKTGARDNAPREIDGRMYHVVPAERYAKLMFVYERINAQAVKARDERNAAEERGAMMSERDRKGDGWRADHDLDTRGAPLKPGS